MRVMSKIQEQVLQQLVRLAKGDPLLVERALRAAGKEKEDATLSDVIAYIKKHSAIEQRKRA